jgi:glycosyltransferase involved in cell wall biosynthesis|tara:strand:+ start:323 stop:1057 length:735 start_codon:yes stop_codon:yes gene_type:complete
MKKYKITIITVTKNSEKYLKKNINSVLKQKYKNYEHILVDGNSTDNTVEIIRSYKKKVRLIKNRNDKGLYHAMNVGIKKAKGDIIGILNSDDIYFKNTLKIVNNYFCRDKNLDFLFGSVYKHKLLSGYNPWKISFSFGFYSTHSVGFFIKKKSQIKVGLYNLKYKYSSDYDLFIRMIKKFKLKGTSTKKNEIFGKFRRGGLSSKIKFLDYLKECNKIRINNGQNTIFVYILYFLRLIKNYKKII